MRTEAPYTPIVRMALVSLFFLTAACGVSRGLHVSFNPAGGMETERFSPRDMAVITKKAPAELLLEGHVLIGIVGVSREEGEADINAHVLEEAARRGGDLVILKKDNVSRSETRYKPGLCLQEQLQTQAVPEYETVCDYSVKPPACSQRQTGTRLETRSQCVQWEQIPYTVYLTESVAQVYRREPARVKKMGGRVLIESIASGHPEEAMELIRGGAPATERGKNGETALSEAAGKGYNDLIKALLSKGADINEAGTGGDTPLASAAENGRLETVKLLVSRGAVLSGDAGGSALLAALSGGHASVANYLAGKGARLQGADTARVLRSAAKQGKMESVKLLLQYGADADGKNPANGYTALMAAVEQEHLSVAKLLLQRGADVNAKNRGNGLTPLFYAVRNGQAEMVQLLIANHADVSARIGKYGNSLLQEAAGNSPILKLLREAGAKK